MSSHALTALSPYAAALKVKLEIFVKNHCIPAELEYEKHMSTRSGANRWTMDAIPPCMERLKLEAKKQGLWNLFLPHTLPSHIPKTAIIYDRNESVTYSLAPLHILSNREYGILCEIMGKSSVCPEACNCSAPDTGNMEVLLKHGTISQQTTYLIPLLKGEIRSTFLMTEPDVASSDATNIQSTLTKRIQTNKGPDNIVTYQLNGKKWWSTGAMDPRCKVAIVLTRMDYSHPSCPSPTQKHTKNSKRKEHGAHTMVIVPMNTKGVHLVRPLTVFGYDDAPHGHAEVLLDKVELDESSLLLGEGKGFLIAQSRLGPGRIHHCMRAVGLATRCYELMLERTIKRKTFGKFLYQHGGCQEQIANAKIDVESARLLTLSCAQAIDTVGPAKARDQIAMIKVAVPAMALRVVDTAVQIYGGAGVSQDFILAGALAGLRTLRIADGPDAVHLRTLALMEIKKAKKQMDLLKKSSKL